MKASMNMLAGLAVSLPAIAANATLWNIDLNSANGVTSGAGVVGSAGDQWNVYDTGDVNNALVATDSAGGNAIGFSFAAPGGNIFGFNPSGAPNPAELFDGFGSSQNNGPGSAVSQLSFTFSGLVPNTTYDIIAYGASQDGTDRGTLFFGDVNTPILAFTDGSSTDVTSAVNTSWDDFQLTTDAAGSFTINTNFNSNTSAQGPVNGFQIDGPAVPEPIAGTALALTLLAIRRRRSA